MLHGKQNLPFLGNLVEKASCIDDKTVLFCYTLFINCFSVICLKSVSQRETAVSSQKRPQSAMDTDNPYQVACRGSTAHQGGRDGGESGREGGRKEGRRELEREGGREGGREREHVYSTKLNHCTIFTK